MKPSRRPCARYSSGLVGRYPPRRCSREAPGAHGVQERSSALVTPEQLKVRWRGVLAPLVTPFLQDGSLDLDSLRRNVAWLIERGARQGNTVLLAAGSGGDFPMMNLQER